MVVLMESPWSLPPSPQIHTTQSNTQRTSDYKKSKIHYLFNPPPLSQIPNTASSFLPSFLFTSQIRPPTHLSKFLILWSVRYQYLVLPIPNIPILPHPTYPFLYPPFLSIPFLSFPSYQPTKYKGKKTPKKTTFNIGELVVNNRKLFAAPAIPCM